MKSAKVEYDEEVDAAYVYFGYPIEKEEANETVEVGDDIMLDFDVDGKLIGMEILNATRNLKDKELLKARSA